MEENNFLEKIDSPKKAHDFHLVDQSPWPILTAIALFSLAIGGAAFLHYELFFGHLLFYLSIVGVTYCLYKWWADVVKEGREDKAHTVSVQAGLRLGMVLFIISEIMFFCAFFGSLFKSIFLPAEILDGVWPISKGVWPPKNIEVLDAWNLPFMNSIILLLSGTTVTWAHHELHQNNRKDLVKALLITIILGLSFTSLQLVEYIHAPFKFKDGIYPSNFYMATGFHGFHVIVGTIFLIVCYFRAKKGHFDQGNNSLGFEFAAWYWHFVDVIWLGLFFFMYIIGG